MTGPTHRQYSIFFAYITLMLFHKLGVTSISYYLAIPIVLMSARYGSLFPDLDHSWKNVGDKTFLNRVINLLIHATGGKHRSWQTHSWDICLMFTLMSYLIPNKLYSMNYITEINKEVAILILLGFSSGWISHLFSDSLTSGGSRLICFSKFKIKLVPKKIGKFKFSTGTKWEEFNYKTLKVINAISGIVCLLYPIIISKGGI